MLFVFIEAGIPAESIIVEAAHNALAFGQFVNTLYKLAVDKFATELVGLNIPAPGCLNVEKFTGNTAADLLKPFPPIDFFSKYEAAPSDDERINVVREVFRLLLPNDIWLSTAQKAEGANKNLTLGECMYDILHLVFWP